VIPGHALFCDLLLVIGYLLLVVALGGRLLPDMARARRLRRADSLPLRATSKHRNTKQPNTNLSAFIRVHLRFTTIELFTDLLPAGFGFAAAGGVVPQRRVVVDRADLAGARVGADGGIACSGVV